MASHRPKRSILAINPNTTTSMTDALKALIESLGFPETRFSYFSAASGVPSINNEDDAAVSTEACLPSLEEYLSEFDGFLVCCYSKHPLVPRLRQKLIIAKLKSKVVIGIFEASIAACIQTIDVDRKFGIVSTGRQWGEILGDAMTDLLGSRESLRYVGTETTALNANELHTTPKDEVERRLKLATKNLLRKDATAICLGCAGMAGMGSVVRQACVEYFGVNKGKEIKIIDGVVAGALFLEGSLRAGW